MNPEAFDRHMLPANTNSSLSSFVYPVLKKLENRCSSVNRSITAFDLLSMAQAPVVISDDRKKVPVILMFDNDCRRYSAAPHELHGAVAIKHSSLAFSKEDIQQLYGEEGLNVPFLAFTASSHTPESEAWVVIVPFAESINGGEARMIATGIIEYLEAVPDRVRWYQAFLAPHKKSSDTEYLYINELGSPENWLCPKDSNSAFIEAAIKGWESYLAKQSVKEMEVAEKSDEVEQCTEAADALSWIYSRYTLEEVLERHGYLKKSPNLFQSPSSVNRMPGVWLFTLGGRRVAVSHHSRQDPLSRIGCARLALDVADVLCILAYECDFPRMLREEALLKKIAEQKAAYTALVHEYCELKLSCSYL